MANDLWETPQYIFDWLHLEFDFDVDVAANENNTKCNHYINEEDNSLTTCWAYSFNDCLSKDRKKPVCWLNPPYSDPLPWVEKAYIEGQRGATVVCLLPADISTKWFHDWVIGKAEIRLVQGRIQFNGPKKGAPKFGSLIAIYGPSAKIGVVSVKRPDRPAGG